MNTGKVDPAALLIAVVAVAGVTLTTAGPWDVMNTVVALVVLIVLWAHTIDGQSKRNDRERGESVAVGTVIGVVFAMFVAFPIQALKTDYFSPPKNLSRWDINFATWISLGAGPVVAILLAKFVVTPSPRAEPGEPADPGDDTILIVVG
jgi:hypothetical protein